MSVQINASTSVVLVDASQLTAGQSAVVLLSSVQTPGRVITVRDSTGYVSTPQSIIVSTMSGTKFSDGTSSISITQPFGFISFESRDAFSWNTINTFGFPLYQTIANVKSLATSTITAQTIFASNTISTNYLNTNSAYLQSTMQVFGPSFVSSLVVGMYPSDPFASRYAPYAFYVNGITQLNSNVTINGQLNVQQTISTGAALLIGGSLSTLGNAGIGGSVSATGNFQVGGNVTVGSMTVQGATTMIGNLTVGNQVTVQNSLNVANTVSTSYVTASTVNVFSSITFGTKTLVSTATGLSFSAPLSAPSISTVSMTVSDTLTTNTLSVTGTINASNAPLFVLGSTDIQNPGGNLTISDVTTNTLDSLFMTTTVFTTSSMTADGVTMTGNLVGSSNSSASLYGLNANTISTQNVFAGYINASTINASSVTASSIIVQQSLNMNSGSLFASNLQFNGTNLSVSSVGAYEIYTSSLTVNSGTIQQSYPLTIQPGLFTPSATISTLTTSSLYVTGNMNMTNVSMGSITTTGSNGPYLLATNLANVAVVSGTGDYLNPLVFSNTAAGVITGSFYIAWNAGSPIPNSIVNVSISLLGGGQSSAYVQMAGQNGSILSAYGPGNTSVTSNFAIDSSVGASLNVLNLTGTMLGTSAFSISATYSSNANYTNIDSNSILSFYNGGLAWNYSLNDTVIRNPYNDMTIRNVYYYGGISFTSDALLKENIEPANLTRCYETIRSLPVRRFKYTDQYISTFGLTDIHRLGVLANEVAEFFPKSVTHTQIPGFESTFRTVDIQQIEMAHLGATKYLMRQVDALQKEVEALTAEIR